MLTWISPSLVLVQFPSIHAYENANCLSLNFIGFDLVDFFFDGICIGSEYCQHYSTLFKTNFSVSWLLFGSCLHMSNMHRSNQKIFSKITLSRHQLVPRYIKITKNSRNTYLPNWNLSKNKAYTIYVILCPTSGP